MDAQAADTAGAVVAESAPDVAPTEAATQANPAGRTFKIPPRRVPADECAVAVGRVVKDGQIVDPGTNYFPHQGEWVEVLPVGSVQALFRLAQLQQQASDSADGETPAESVARVGAAFEQIAAQLAQRIVAWNWTDLAGDPIEQPWRRPDVLMGLDVSELTWLLSVTAGETTGERKNASAPSVST